MRAQACANARARACARWTGRAVGVIPEAKRPEFHRGEGVDVVAALTRALAEAGYTGPYFNDVWGTREGANWTLLNRHADFSARSGSLLVCCAQR